MLCAAEVIVNYLASHVLLVYNESRQKEIIRVYDAITRNMPEDQRREYSFNSTIPDDQCELIYYCSVTDDATDDDGDGDGGGDGDGDGGGVESECDGTMQTAEQCGRSKPCPRQSKQTQKTCSSEDKRKTTKPRFSCRL